MRNLLIWLIRCYQKYLSPLKAPACRFYPTCSEYSIQALQKYGLARGSLKACIRIMKCHPFHPGGHDPV